MNNTTKELFPDVYHGVRETEALFVAEDTLFLEAEQEIQNAKNNQYIMTSNETGISVFEKLLNIKPDLTSETLEFRRSRAFSRWSGSPPYTLRYLQSKLDELIGVGKWTTVLDSDNYTLYIESSAKDQNWYQEIAITMASIKPANIVFVNKPYLADAITLNEQIELNEQIYNYKLGVSWLLGGLPFASSQSKGVVKMSETPSVQAQMLSNVASFVASDIAKVRLNGSAVLSSFTVKSTSANLVTVEYTVPAGMLTETITKVELLDANSNVLTSAAVYIPIGDSLMLKHTLTVKEG